MRNFSPKNWLGAHTHTYVHVQTDDLLLLRFKGLICEYLSYIVDIELCCCAPAKTGTLLLLSMAVHLRESCVLQDVVLFSSSYNISVNFTAKCMHDGFLV
jgi:hypothetical protein